ncbi:MAG: NUDIX hydrolase, partial [Frankiales bacterium]|nr:NUDIX hydrolase [Frankiales bacterium]
EAALAAAHRELMEEAGLAADTWHVLVDTLTSPGMTDEAIRIFLARDVREVERDVQEHEEAELTTEWVDLDQAVSRAAAGEIENAMCVVGLLAADRAVRNGFTTLRPSDAPWPSQKRA